jgi:hypothetical protein
MESALDDCPAKRSKKTREQGNRRTKHAMKKLKALVE